MGFISIANGLTIQIPTDGTTNYGQTLKTECWEKISGHDHTGAGKGSLITHSALDTTDTFSMAWATLADRAQCSVTVGTDSVDAASHNLFQNVSYAIPTFINNTPAVNVAFDAATGTFTLGPAGVYELSLSLVLLGRPGNTHADVIIGQNFPGIAYQYDTAVTDAQSVYKTIPLYVSAAAGDVILPRIRHFSAIPAITGRIGAGTTMNIRRIA